MKSNISYKVLSLFDYPEEDYKQRMKRLIRIFDSVIKIQEEKIRIMEGKSTENYVEINLSAIMKEMKNRGPTNE